LKRHLEAIGAPGLHKSLVKLLHDRKKPKPEELDIESED
jgi:hypothetical protein